MAVITPFSCIRPRQNTASRVAALPYDVYNRQEAKLEIQREPMSFLKIDRAETYFDDSVDAYAPCVYEKAKELLEEGIADGTFLTDETACYYIYELTMDGRAQTGIAACASIDDYLNQVIKKHENTREEKEIDRITHVDTLDAQTGPIFLAYRSNPQINQTVESKKKDLPLYDFTAADGIGHRVWRVDHAKDLEILEHAFAEIDSIYIADGHHRAASAVKVGLKRRQQNPNYHGKEEFNFFLSVLFPDDQLMIMDYNRAVKDLNSHTKEEFLDLIGHNFKVEKMGEMSYKPKEKAEFAMYLDGIWYRLRAGDALTSITDAVDSLDASLLQNYLLEPILGIKDVRTDKRIDFIGGIRGLEELERRVHEDMEVAFALYPTSIAELFAVADAGKLMPPKSTWFEPKLRSGLFLHKLS